jgi:D-alanyl-D-alanine carboxypeptidase/D-alanyl-D-alanine-endopeptidase (penicillin-binding protein 4)
MGLAGVVFTGVLAAAAASGPALAATPSATAQTAAAPAEAQLLPPEVRHALRSAGVPAEAFAAVVHDATTGQRVLRWNDARPMNPASLMKLLTTQAALERLGPAWTWATPVWIAGAVDRQGVLDGSVFIKGSGDPKLVLERTWLLLRRLQQQHGVREIRGDIVLDNGAFVLPEGHPAEFDNEPLRPYNVRPSALLFNQRSVSYTIVPDPAAQVARIVAEPALADTVVDRSVPLVAGPCDDWRAALKASFEPGRVRFGGSYAASCGEREWPVADPQPATHDARLLAALWREMGGVLHGTVREGAAPAEPARPAFEWRSPPLVDVVRDINKFSNNVMAQQLFLSLALHDTPTRAPRASTTPEAARELLLRWAVERSGPVAPDDELVIDNGSGLSRSQRISARRLARLLVAAFDSPVMPELMASLPIVGLDGTLRRARGGAVGRAHLKTGSLRDVAGVAGYVLSASGRRYVVVAIVNHPQAQQARGAMEALVQWAARDAPAHRSSGDGGN